MDVQKWKVRHEHTIVLIICWQQLCIHVYPNMSVSELSNGGELLNYGHWIGDGELLIFI